MGHPAIDVLVIDAMGKDISGAGMDTNIIGRVLPDSPAAAAHVRAHRRAAASAKRLAQCAAAPRGRSR